MMDVNWRVASAIARTEFRRRLRRVREDTWQLVAIGLLVLFALPFAATGVVGLFALGAAIGTDAIQDPIAIARYGVVYAWIGIALFGGYRAYSAALDPDRLAGMLTAISHRELVAGLFLTEFVLWGSILGAFLIPGAIALSLGALSPTAGPLLILVGGFVIVTALLCGFNVALLVRNMGVRSVLLTRLRLVLLGLLGVVYFGLLFTQTFESVLGPLYAVLSPTPLGWGADLLLVGTVADASVPHAIASFGSGLASIWIGWLGLNRFSRALWYANGVHITHSSDAGIRGQDWIVGRFRRPIAGVLIADWTRARRKPITLSFVLYPMIVLVGPITATVEAGTIGTGLPIWILFCSVWITGVLFTLNVVGSEGAVLPVTLLADRSRRAMIGGHLAASMLIGVPLAVVATVLVSIASPHAGWAVASLAISALILSVSAALIATGVGARFPRFDEVSVTRSTTAVVPSMFAFGTYSLILGIVALPAMIGHSGLAGVVGGVFGVSVLVVRLTGTVVSAVLATAIGIGSVTYALRRIERFDVDG